MSAARHPGMNRIRTFACEVVEGKLVKLDQIRSDEVTRLQPALTFDQGSNRFVLAWRDQNFVTSLSTARMAPDERRWGTAFDWTSTATRRLDWRPCRPVVRRYSGTPPTSQDWSVQAMTTLSHAVPSLEARVLAASLIVVGSVEEGPVSAADYTTDPAQVHSQFRVAIESTLRGRAPGCSVLVRVLGGQVDQLRTEWSRGMREEDRVLMFLTPYYAAEREDDIFVPYSRGCYTVSVEGSVTLGPRETMSIDEVRAFIGAVVQRWEQANASLPEREAPEVDLSESATAMLNVEPGGARWATFEAGDQARRSGG